MSKKVMLVTCSIGVFPFLIISYSQAWTQQFQFANLLLNQIPESNLPSESKIGTEIIQNSNSSGEQNASWFDIGIGGGTLDITYQLAFNYSKWEHLYYRFTWIFQKETSSWGYPAYPEKINFAGLLLGYRINMGWSMLTVNGGAGYTNGEEAVLDESNFRKGEEKFKNVGLIGGGQIYFRKPPKIYGLGVNYSYIYNDNLPVAVLLLTIHLYFDR